MVFRYFSHDIAIAPPGASWPEIASISLCPGVEPAFPRFPRACGPSWLKAAKPAAAWATIPQLLDPDAFEILWPQPVLPLWEPAEAGPTVSRAARAVGPSARGPAPCGR